MYICSCFGITEAQIREHAAAGACTPRLLASASRAGTDCGSCVRRIQGLLGRGACPRREGAGLPAEERGGAVAPVAGGGSGVTAVPPAPAAA
ncbi:(2Fe-2S)-binding protein [Streptomyces sp. TRM 70361]|uniref:(2Fe-2S)-binding protein n=1 Tax=Streptomyces sp. TRM 70361 TaxID=3116553 RepID=UPI002E7B070A|nr:(2Fe-2S)-binding protein [Streptomyces sp. TRM 70361]MEE1942461.1 (2Fe-2S)-binding protein [Streptomyces sp. TRM 70361]